MKTKWITHKLPKQWDTFPHTGMVWAERNGNAVITSFVSVSAGMPWQPITAPLTMEQELNLAKENNNEN